MILIAGLGNPGDEYKDTRHNVGFMLIDKILGSANFTNLTSSKFQGELYKTNSFLLLKPTTFMNLSGNSMKAVKDFYKPEKIIVIHDDLDLKFGAVRFKNGGSSGGHNGIKSIDNLIGNDYDRVRIGIGRSDNAKSYVLGKFSDDEMQKLDEILLHCQRAVFDLAKDDVKNIAQKYTLKP